MSMSRNGAGILQGAERILVPSGTGNAGRRFRGTAKSFAGKSCVFFAPRHEGMTRRWTLSVVVRRPPWSGREPGIVPDARRRRAAAGSVPAGLRRRGPGGRTLTITFWNVDWFPGRRPKAGERAQGVARGGGRAGGRTARPRRARAGGGFRRRRRAPHRRPSEGFPRRCLHGVHPRPHERAQPPADRPVQPVAAAGERLAKLAADRRRPAAAPGLRVCRVPTRAGGSAARLRGSSQEQCPRRTRRRRDQHRHARGIRAPAARPRTRGGGPLAAGGPGAAGGDRRGHEHLARRRALRLGADPARCSAQGGFLWAWAGVPSERRFTLPGEGRYPAACFDHVFYRVEGGARLVDCAMEPTRTLPATITRSRHGSHGEGRASRAFPVCRPPHSCGNTSRMHSDPSRRRFLALLVFLWVLPLRRTARADPATFTVGASHLQAARHLEMGVHQFPDSARPSSTCPTPSTPPARARTWCSSTSAPDRAAASTTTSRAGSASSSKRTARRSSRSSRAATIKGTKVTRVRVDSGTFSSGMPGGPTTPMENYGLYGAILESPQGNVFIKMTGPADMVRAAAANFEALVQSPVLRYPARWKTGAGSRRGKPRPLLAGVRMVVAAVRWRWAVYCRGHRPHFRRHDPAGRRATRARWNWPS